MRLENLSNPKVHIGIIGYIWQPGVGLCAYEYSPRVARAHGRVAGEIDGEWGRETVEQWLAVNAGDFQSVVDFHATLTWDGERCGECGHTRRECDEIEWRDEENECEFLERLA